MATYEQVVPVKDRLFKELYKHKWFRGIGVEPDPDEGFVVSLRIAHGTTPEPTIPSTVDGVAVRVTYAGQAVALDPS